MLDAGHALMLVREQTAAPAEQMAPREQPAPQPTPVAPPSAPSSEPRYRQLFDSMIEGSALFEIICDAAGQPVDYRYLAVNPAFERLTHLNARDVVGRTAREITPQTEPRWLDQLANVALTQTTANFDSWVEEFHRYLHISAFCPAPDQCA
ncbi:MAG: PAS domain-containing protein, partial [Kiritimatiellaeota bacterium]|nr:PAS domain-containing protein [Kiritimatiellota bacterium]